MAQARKKKTIRLDRARVHVHSTFNNTIITVTDLTGSGRQAVVQTLRSLGIQVEEVRNVTPVSHS